MKWFTDDKIKHRVIGLAVLMSIALVFIPAMVKKSNQRLDEKMNLSVRMPPKPSSTQVVAEKPKELFKALTVAHVVLPQVVENKSAIKIARAESLSGQTMATRTVIQKAPVIANNPNKVNKSVPNLASVKLPLAVKIATQMKTVKQDMFSVQLASFARQDNALSLIQQLYKKGFKASYDKRGGQYRVLVGQLQLDQAKNLQKKLANVTQLNGFLVKVG